MSKHAVCDAFYFLEVIYPFSPSLWTLSMWVPRFILWGDLTWVAYSRSCNTIYLLSGVLCFRGAYGIIFTFFGTYMVENQQNNLLPRPDNTISYQYWSQYRYSDISLFIFGAFQNRYCMFLHYRRGILVYCAALLRHRPVFLELKLHQILFRFGVRICSAGSASLALPSLRYTTVKISCL